MVVALLIEVALYRTAAKHANEAQKPVQIMQRARPYYSNDT